jgi:3-oxoadipate enol-lactonase
MASFAAEDGVTIVYDDLGPRDGIPVVLCHGLAAAGEQLSADAAYFAAEGFRVLVPDLRGHGRSGKPRTLAAYALPRFASDLAGMLEHAGVGPVHWVGNSLGGIVALQALRDHEQRFRTLATFGTAYRLNLPPWSGVAIPIGYGIVGRGLMGSLTAVSTTRNRAARPLIAKLIRQNDPMVGRLVTANIATYDLVDNAKRARLPILMLRGGRDNAVNAALPMTLKAMQGRKNFTLVELPEGGHCANLDATEAWRAALLAFWKDR